MLRHAYTQVSIVTLNSEWSEYSKVWRVISVHEVLNWLFYIELALPSLNTNCDISVIFTFHQVSTFKTRIKWNILLILGVDFSSLHRLLRYPKLLWNLPRGGKDIAHTARHLVLSVQGQFHTWRVCSGSESRYCFGLFKFAEFPSQSPLLTMFWCNTELSYM